MSRQTVSGRNRIWNRNNDFRGRYNKNQCDEYDDVRSGEMGKTNYRAKNTRRVSFKQSGGGETRDRQFNNKSRRKLNLALQTLDDSDDDMGNSPHRVNATLTNRRRRSSIPGDNGPYQMRTLIAGTSEWFHIMIPHGQKYGKDLILKALQDFVTSSSFVPHHVKIESSALCLYVNNLTVAQTLLNADRQFTLPDGFKMIIRVRNKLPPAESDAHLKEKMKLAMAKRYTVATKALDLSKFHKDVELKDIFCPLAQLRIMLVAIDVITETVPHLEALDLSDNNIRLLHHLRCLATKLPSLKVLHLANNKIKSPNALDALHECQLVDLVVKGNPLEDRLNAESAYVSEMRKKFPKLKRLDFVELAPHIGFDVCDDASIPMPKATYLCDSNGIDIVRAFLQQYFTIFDSDNRQPLLDAYHEHAMFSLTANHNSQKGLRLGTYLTHNRNIMRNKNVESSCRHLKNGRLAVVTLLSQLPATQHDFSSFAVDLLCFTPNLVQLTVTGVFREHNKEIRNFHRTLILVPSANGGFWIKNEMLNINHATVVQLKTAFKSSAQSSPSTSPTPVTRPMEIASQQPTVVATPTMEVVEDKGTTSTMTVPIPTAVATKLEMVQLMSQRSNMNLEWSEKCLMETNWDFDRAMMVFTEFNNHNQIPAEAFAKINK